MKIFFALIVFVSCSISEAADFRSQVKAKRSAHDVAAVEARNELEAVIREAIKEAANGDKIDKVRSLVEIRDKLIFKSQLPDVPELEAATKRYVEKRKESARSVYDAYREAIAGVAKELMIEDAAVLRSELRSFVNAERVAIGLPPHEEEPKESPSGSPTSPTAVKDVALFDDTGEFLRDLITRLELDVGRLSELETSAKQQEAFAKLIRKYDDELKKTTLTFSFPIENVLQEPGGYRLQLGAPRELEEVDHKSAIAAVVEKLGRNEALAIGKSSVYQVSGVGRLVVRTYENGVFREPQNMKRVFAFDIDESDLRRDVITDGNGRYGIYLQEMKSKIIR